MIAAPFRHPWGWAAAAPAACAVHCAAMPLVAVAAPTFAPGGAVEWSLLVVTVLFATFALAGGIRSHGSPAPIFPVVFGIVLWGAILLLFEAGPLVEVMNVGAATLVAGGLLWNSRLSCAEKESCPACHEHHSHEEEALELAAETSL